MVENRVHTFIWKSEETIIIAEVNGYNFDWKTFFHFYEMGDEYVFAVMPQLTNFIDIHAI